jgi:hypothetical protein
MKKINSLLTGLLLTASVFMTQQAIAQAPQKMSYQSVIRNSSNALLANTQVGIRISVLQGTASGTAVYVETQTATTNGNGLLSIQIGTGVVVTGSFAGINWAAGPYFIKTETDPAGGTTYSITGTQQMMSVPYALYAETSGQSGALTAWSKTGNAGTVDGTNFIGTTDNVPLSIRVNNQKAGRIDPTLNNSFWGYQAGNSNTTGYENTAIGSVALFNNTTGIRNSANGFNALYSNTTGGDNTANGYFALYSNTFGSANTANGVNTLRYNTTGIRNSANGYQVLFSNTTGSFNTANGNEALALNTEGNYNTANGNNALLYNTTGNSNVAVGTSALYSNTTGARNVAIGESSLLVNTIGTQNTALGSEADVVTNALTNATAIGYGAKVDASNKIQLGNSSVTDVNTSGTYTAAGFKTPAGSSSQYLMADGSTSTGTVATTMGAIAGSSTTNGGTITSGVLSLAPANGTNAGIVTTGSQTFAGNKTFSSPITITAGSGAGKVLTSDGNGVAFWANSGGFATAGPGISITGTGTSINPYVVSTKIYTIGLWPELGGYVFRISADGRHGLVAETENMSSFLLSWWTANNDINQPTSLSANGQNFMDWRLPAINELTEMYTQRVAIGGFGSSLFWSSTESDANNAFRMDFSSGNYETFVKYNSGSLVRAVRAF